MSSRDTTPQSIKDACSPWNFKGFPACIEAVCNDPSTQRSETTPTGAERTNIANDMISEYAKAAQSWASDGIRFQHSYFVKAARTLIEKYPSLCGPGGTPTGKRALDRKRTPVYAFPPLMYEPAIEVKSLGEKVLDSLKPLAPVAATAAGLAGLVFGAYASFRSMSLAPAQQAFMRFTQALGF